MRKVNPYSKEKEEQIIKIVCSYTGFTLEQMASKKDSSVNFTEVTEARKLLCYFLKDIDGVLRIGELINRDHSTVSYMTKSIRDLLIAKDKVVVVKVREILKQIEDEIQDSGRYRSGRR